MKKAKQNKNMLKMCLLTIIIISFIIPNQNLIAEKTPNTSSNQNYINYIEEETQFSNTFVSDEYYTTDDTIVDWTQKDTPLGDLNVFIIRLERSGQFELSSLLKFDISSIPSNATITSASVNLYYWHFNDGNPVGRNLDIHRITSDWDEDTATWNNRPNVDPTVTSGSVVPGSFSWMSWDVTSDVQDFASGLESNFGWQIMDEDVDPGFLPMIYFYTKEHSNSDYHPHLNVEYEIEEEPVMSNWLGNVQISNSISSAESPMIKTDSFGDLHIVWHDFRDYNWEIYYKKIGNDGSIIVDDTRLTYDSASSMYPSLDIDNLDNIHIVWQDERVGNYQIYYTKLDNNGVTLVDDLRLTETVTLSKYPVPIISDTDNVHVSWQDDRDGNWEVYYKKLDNDGIILVDDTRITNQINESLSPSLALYYDTIAHLTWHDDRNGDFGIYYDEIFIDLTPSSIIYQSNNQTIPYVAKLGEQLDFEITIDNLDDIPVDNVKVEILWDTSVISTQYVEVLGGSSTSFSCSYTPLEQGFHNVFVRVDPDEELVEYNMVNNELGITVPVADPMNIHDSLIISGPEMYMDMIIACNQLTIDISGDLFIDNGALIIYGTNPNIINNGILRMNNVKIKTSHDSEYITQFNVGTTPPATLELTHCEIDHLGGEGIKIMSDENPPLITDTIIRSSQNSAITYYNGFYNFDRNSIINSGSYDITLHNSILDIYNSYFNRDKINYDDPTSSLMYSREIQCTVWDENGTIVEGANIEIYDVDQNLVYSDTTDENGQIPPTPLPVYTDTSSSQYNYATYSAFGNDPNNGASGTTFMPEEGMAGGVLMPPGNWEIILRDATQTKYAILYAGKDTTAQPDDRYAYWNEIEFMYHILKDIKGYKPENIQVLFMDGKDGTTQPGGTTNSKIDYNANKTNLEKAFQYIGGKIKNDAMHYDTLFIFISDHGSDQYNNAGGIYLCTQDGPYVKDNIFASMIDTYIGENASRISILMGQCYSGGLLDNLRDEDRIVMSAAYYNEPSYWYNKSIDNLYDGHSYFTVEFLSALHNHVPGVGSYPDSDLTNGKTTTTDYYTGYPTDDPYHNTTRGLLNLDDNNNGIISIHEAFDYALDNDLVGPADGRVARKYSPVNYEYPQAIDDDIIVLAGGSSGKIKILRYDGDKTLSGQTLNPGGTLKQIHVCYMDSYNGEDIITLDQAGDQVKVMLNNGDWSFTTSNYGVGDNPSGLVVADFDGNGYQDVATTDTNDNKISVLKNNGFGALGSRKTYSVGSSPKEIIASNIDSDFDNDLIVCNYEGKSISVLFNNGGGAFTTKTDYRLVGKPSGIAIGDVTGDYYRDIIVTLQDVNKAVILKNNGQGVFTIFDNLTTKSNPICPKIVDINTDLWNDLIIVHSSVSSVLFFKNDAYGVFSENITKNTNPMNGARDLYLNDLDGDGDKDAIITVKSNSKDYLNVLINDNHNNEGRIAFSTAGAEELTSGFKAFAIHGTNFNRGRYWYL